MFGTHWTDARGTVVARRVTGNKPDGTVIGEEFVVDVRTADGTIFRAQVGQPRIATDFLGPRVGREVRVQYDARSARVRFDKHDPALSRKALLRSGPSSFDAVLHSPAGTPDRTADAYAQLQAMLDNGVLGRR